VVLSAVRLTTKEFQYSSNTISWHLLLSECAACFSCGFLATSEPETQTVQDLALKDANHRHPTSVRRYLWTWTQKFYNWHYRSVAKIPLKNSWLQIVIRISTKNGLFLGRHRNPQKFHKNLSTTSWVVSKVC